MKLNKLIVKLEELKKRLEKVNLGDVMIGQVEFPEIYEGNFEEIYVSSALKDETGKIFIKIGGHKTKVPQNLNRINLLKEVPIGTCGHIIFYDSSVNYIKIGDQELFGREAEEYCSHKDEN